MRNIAILMFLLTISLSSCKLFDKSTTDETITTEQAQQTIEEKPLLVSISLGPCFGTCPVYKASIYQDGTVRYKGSLNVKKEGIYTAKIGSGKLNDIRHMLRTSRFSELNENYDAHIPDFPIYSVVGSIDGEEKRVTSQGDAPENLRSFQKYLIRVVDEIQDWEKVDEEM